MFTNPVRPRTRQKLASMAEPSVVSGGQSEALEWDLYDTQLYVSTTTTNLTFFSAAPATRFISNLNGAGLPTPQYFEAYYFGLIVHVAPGNIDAWTDVFRLVKGAGGATLVGLPTWSFTLADKEMGPFPLVGLQDMGGVTGFSTRTEREYANNGTLLATFCADGAVVIPPTQAFRMDLRWPAAVTLTANTQLTAFMRGVLHRRVL